MSMTAREATTIDVQEEWQAAEQALTLATEASEDGDLGTAWVQAQEAARRFKLLNEAGVPPA
jgi:hypothetical protein